MRKSTIAAALAGSAMIAFAAYAQGLSPFNFNLVTSLPGGTSSYVLNVQGNASGTPIPVSGSGSSSPAVGAATIATGQYSNATASATAIVSARTGAAGTGRVSLTLYNTSSVNIYIGITGVTSSTGIRILPGGSFTINTTAAVYGVPASGTGTLDYIETY